MAIPRRITLLTRRVNLLAAGLILFVLADPGVTQAEHFNINLVAVGPDGVTAEAFSDQSPPPGGYNPRPLLKVQAGKPITVQFIMTNVYPHGAIKDTGVRYFVVREEKPGQKTVPELKQGVVTQGSFTWNLKPKARIGARLRLVINKPGFYLVRVETLRTRSDHEHFSAIDIQVQ